MIKKILIIRCVEPEQALLDEISPDKVSPDDFSPTEVLPDEEF